MPIEIVSDTAGTVWRIEISVGDQVAAHETLVILESMKMEIPFAAPQAGTVTEIRVTESQVIDSDDVLLLMDPEA